MRHGFLCRSFGPHSDCMPIIPALRPGLLPAGPSGLGFSYYPSTSRITPGSEGLFSPAGDHAAAALKCGQAVPYDEPWKGAGLAA